MLSGEEVLGGGHGRVFDEKIEGDMGVTSHWMPQSVMLAGAERVFRFEECMSPEGQMSATTR